MNGKSSQRSETNEGRDDVFAQDDRPQEEFDDDEWEIPASANLGESDRQRHDGAGLTASVVFVDQQ
ncbi:hypothetical protein GUITHDRAFT_152601 [Guillardia theta CCMP2712]|uniref:Uncharacterized protein n=1 Tax=Guillardia theta (strain CCMP2712) TaxID=905079 RepID=L1JCS8_GUITC|nr:hypothetical protein GUITHDRAFT_152601 [Guillardia theta CCMP2712]EKX45905.1 hypothetical protein GUITHDRAFT_152601 [Guillardia theta CCMP2712]|eukprot:XP_005832885.1 hypothetical protein GUITHDRAFT_152601 [Guillardia theta CCMP2712]